MPRPTLPSALTNLKLFDVTLTQHTEDDLLAFYMKELEEFKRVGHMMLERKSNWIHDFLLGPNPYAKVNWKSNGALPERVDFDWASGASWLEEKEEVLLKFKHDIYLLDRVFKYEETKDGFREILYEVEKISSMNTEYDLDFKRIDAGFFKKSHETWKKKNQEYLEMRELDHEHTLGQHTMAYWQSAMPKEHPQFFLEHIKPKTLKCKACINSIQADLDRKELEAMRQAEAEEEKKVETVVPPKRVIQTYTCELCSFSTQHKALYDRHMESKEHLQKQNLASWYCDACKIQCRTLIEHTHHLSTRKHRQNTGQIEKDPEIFRCEACNYSTPIKQVFQRHCNSKGHLAKTSS